MTTMPSAEALSSARATLSAAEAGAPAALAFDFNEACTVLIGWRRQEAVLRMLTATRSRGGRGTLGGVPSTEEPDTDVRSSAGITLGAGVTGCWLGVSVALPLLAVASTPLTLGLALFVFGGALGSLDVAMNIHAVEVEKAAKKPLMSGFHGLYSVGGFIGSLFAIFLLSLGVAPLPRFMATEALASGALVPVLPGWRCEPIPLYIVYPPNRHLSNKVRVFVDWLVRLLADAELGAPARAAGRMKG